MKRIFIGSVAVVLLFCGANAAWGDEKQPRSATLELTLVDEDNNQPLPHGSATLFPPDEKSSATEIRPEQQRKDDALAFRLKPGDYSIIAKQSPFNVNGLQYEPAEKEIHVNIAEDELRQLTLKLRARPLTPKEIDQKAPFTAVGRVTDLNGQSIANAEVRAATGWGSLIGGGRTRTNAEGEYVLRFGVGIFLGGDQKSQFQASHFLVSADGYVEQHRTRPYKFLAYVMPDPLPKNIKAEEIVIKASPARLDFVLAPAATVEVKLIDAEDKPAKLKGLTITTTQERTGSMRCLTTDLSKTSAVVWAVLPNHSWRFEIDRTRSTAIDFPAPGKYSLTLRYRPSGAEGVNLLEIVDARNESGEAIDTTAKVNDPFALPPVADAVRDRARELLSRMSEVNARWLRGPAPDLAEFSYRLRFHGGKQEPIKEVTVKPGGRYHGSQQGVSYHSALHQVAADPTIAVIRALDEDPQRIKIAYTPSKPLRSAMGTGTAGTWRGYVSRPVRDATLVLDAKTLTPLEHYDEEVRESFEQYFEIGPNSFVPLRVIIEDHRGGPSFDWRFAWYQPGLWLLHESHVSEERTVNASIEQVKIKGEPSEPMAIAKPITANE